MTFVCLAYHSWDFMLFNVNGQCHTKLGSHVLILGMSRSWGEVRAWGPCPWGGTCCPWLGRCAAPAPAVRPRFVLVYLARQRAGPSLGVWALMWGLPRPARRVPGGHAEVQGVDAASLPELLQPPGGAAGPLLVSGQGESRGPLPRLILGRFHTLSPRLSLHTEGAWGVPWARVCTPTCVGENTSFPLLAGFLVGGTILSHDPYPV